MAGQRENNEVTRTPRPSHRTVTMCTDLQAVLGNIRTVEFALGLLPEKPRDGRIDFEVLEMQLSDARATLGRLALGLSDEAGA